MDESTRNMTVDEILMDIEEEISKNERMIKLSIALEYMVQLVDPKNRDKIREAALKAKTVDDMTKIINVVKAEIGQRSIFNMFGL